MMKNRNVRVFIGIVVAFLLFTVSLTSGAMTTGANINNDSSLILPSIIKTSVMKI